MSYMLQPPIILLREGTDDSQGRPQLISNINACIAVVDITRRTLGPRGSDVLIVENERNVTITNDGATLIGKLDIQHAAARTLVDIARSQDAEVGDGTTSVVVLAGELLKEAKQFVEDGVHPQIIIRGYRKAARLAVEKLREYSTNLEDKPLREKRELLERCAATSLNSKIIAGAKHVFAKMIVDAIFHLEDDLSLELIGIKKVPGGSMEDSFLVEGVAFKKTFSYAGFEQQPKSFENPKVLLLNHELELKAEKENAEVKIENPEQYQAIVDAEWDIIYDKLNKIAESGAKIVLSVCPIGDLATQFFADRDIFCAGRVGKEDARRIGKATGAKIQTSLNRITPDVLGVCGKFEEIQVGNERYNIFKECPQSKTATIVLRGGAEQYIEEAERSLHDAIMIVRRAITHSSIVPGGGATEMELSRHLHDFSRTIVGKEQLIINAFAKALEVIPRQVADNAGFDSTDIMNKLREKHARGHSKFGVDIDGEGVCDTYNSFVWEPALVKRNAIESACEAACVILSVDETVRNPKSEVAKGAPLPGGRGRGMARPPAPGMGRG
nr:T-complex protein 1 subunit eta [Seculamonas ecuadoriensis]